MSMKEGNPWKEMLGEQCYLSTPGIDRKSFWIELDRDWYDSPQVWKYLTPEVTEGYWNKYYGRVGPIKEDPNIQFFKARRKGLPDPLEIGTIKQIRSKPFLPYKALKEFEDIMSWIGFKQPAEEKFDSEYLDETFGTKSWHD